MPSLIADYEYDIFISYRQKDNQLLSGHGSHPAEGWVTEFVTNLKRELEVTFKEEISVYIDENTYDGIREVHEVNESLASKLKCIIFIPIISQTYCDPKCYAWNNEFLIFKQLALTDSIGLKVKLQNGNVASRIVPVRIHELDVQDGLLLMKELGGPLRSIDFIFRTPGVNRPLRANEDHPNDNRNKTYYRDQINKIANSIKEIITSLQAPVNALESKTRTRILAPTRSALGKRLFVYAFFLAALFLVTYFLFQGSFEALSKSDSDRISIAVIPFQSIGEEDESKKFADGVTGVIVSNLIMFPELKVKSRLSVEKYKTLPKTAPEIAEELGVLYVLVGTTQKFGDHIRINVQLIDASTDVNVWSQQFDRKFENIFEIQSQISLSIARSLKAKLTPAIAERIKRPPTSSFEAYDLFLRAKQWVIRYAYSQDPADLNQAIAILNESLRKDPKFAIGYAWLAGLVAAKEVDNLSDQHVKDSILFLAEKALEIDSTVVEAYMVLSEWHHHERDDINALRFTYKALDHIDGLQLTVNNSSDTLIIVQLMDRIASVYARIGDAERASHLYDQIVKLDSGNLDILHQKFYPVAAGRHVDQLLELSNQLARLNKDDPFVDVVMTHAYLEQRDFKNLETMYYKKENVLAEQMELLDQYVLVYATALRRNGNEKEAVKIAQRFQDDLLSGEPYLEAQLLLFNGRYDEGLRVLELVNLGWYNLNLCIINPVFEPVKNDVRFKNFIKRNNDRIKDISDRIYQLEKDGYLPNPETVIDNILFRKKSDSSVIEHRIREKLSDLNSGS